MRHRHRRFGLGPYLPGLPETDRWGVDFPFGVPALDAIEALDPSAPITLLAGDNGTGEATIVEAIAEAMGFAAEGGELERSGELAPVPRPVFDEGAEPVLPLTSPTTAASCGRRASSTSRASSTARASSRPTSRSTAACRCISRRTASRSSRSPRTASPARACTCSTNRRPRCR